jgi:hypothetical protein
MRRLRPLLIATCAVVALALPAVGCGSSGSSESSQPTACASGAPAPGPASNLLPPPYASYSQPGPPPQGLVLAIDGGYGDWSPCEVRERAALGAAVTRHEWQPEEPVDAQDALVLKAATEVHTRLHALLGGNELGDPEAFREFVVAFVKRYGLGGSFWREHPGIDESRYAITSFELGNEPYLGGMSASEYAAAVRPALEAVKELGVPARMILVSGVDADEEADWVETLYEAIPDLNSLFFGFAIHPYTFGAPPAGESPGSAYRQIELLRRVMNSEGAEAKPIWITEYGESTSECGSECVDEAGQAEYLEAVIGSAAEHPEWDVEMVMVFQLIDRGTDTGDRELGFGILREDGAPKLSYPIVSAAAARYRGG